MQKNNTFYTLKGVNTQGVTHIAKESTGKSCLPVYNIQEGNLSLASKLTPSEIKPVNYMASVEDPPSQIEAPPIITDPALLRRAIIESFNHWVSVGGEIVMPCVPAMWEFYTKRIWAMFDAIGTRFQLEQWNQLSEIVRRKLEEGFRLSPHSQLIVNYEPAQPDNKGLTFDVSVSVSSTAEEYQHWVETRNPPLFGTQKDAKVMAVAAQLGEPATAPIVDIGAGNGRNTISLAKLGYPVDALELAPIFIEQLQAVVQVGQITVTLGDIFDPLVRMQPAHYRLAIAAEVVASHCRDVDQLRLFLVKMCDFLSSGGLLLFSLFLAVDNYEPDRVTREMSQVKWSCIFTRRELAAAMEGLAIELISDESVFEYELTHRPTEAWPPNDRFGEWATGGELFAVSGEKSAMELRWILCRRL